MSPFKGRDGRRGRGAGTESWSNRRCPGILCCSYRQQRYKRPTKSKNQVQGKGRRRRKSHKPRSEGLTMVLCQDSLWEGGFCGAQGQVLCCHRATECR